MDGHGFADLCDMTMTGAAAPAELSRVQNKKDPL
jgi:hypothetical protein